MPRKSRVEEDRSSIQVEVVIPVRQSGRAKVMEKTRGPAAPVPAPLPRIPRVTRLMALAIKFQDMVDRGEVRDYADVARLGHVTRARMSQIMNLLLLAPDIQEALLELTEATTITEREVRAAVVHVGWAAQRSAFASLTGCASTATTIRTEENDDRVRLEHAV